MSSKAHSQPTGASPDKFDVFLSYNGKDRQHVAAIADRLRRAGIEPWFDQWRLTPGGRYQDELFAGLQASAACAYFVGPHGEGDWSRMELDVARSRAAKERAFRLFPVLLPGVSEPFDRTRLPPFLSHTTWVDLRLGTQAVGAFQALVNAIKGVPTGAPAAAADDGRPPYRGLLPFGVDDAEFFFGRDADVQRVLEKLRGGRFVAVLGPSGSGKSSLVRAGVVPALQAGGIASSESWPIRLVRPGALPLTVMAASLADFVGRPPGVVLDELRIDERALHLATEAFLGDRGPEARVCWVVDQAEELFTLCHDESERAAFIGALSYAAAIPHGRTTVVLTMRADFYPRLAAFPSLAALVADSNYLVAPLDVDGLRAAIQEPAHRAGLQFEEGLVDTILGDVVDRPGALPLLQHALLELWQRRRGSMLTLEAYRESGGVEAALANRAEATYASFTVEEQEIARRALLRLTLPGDGTEDTRRRAAFRELIGSPLEVDAVEAVINRLAESRLVTVSRAEGSADAWVDLSHEALIRGWPRMRAWIDDDREALRVHRRIADAAAEWERFGRDDDALLRGARLAEANEFAATDPTLMSEDERNFVGASVERQKRERASRDRLRRRTTALAVGLAGVFLVIAATAGLLWLRSEDQRRDADAQRAIAEERQREADQQRTIAEERQREADQQRAIALSRQLAAQASASLGHLDLSLLLSLEAIHVADTVEARSSLLTGLLYEPGLVTFLPGEVGRATTLAFSPDGETLAAVYSDDSIILWDFDHGESIGAPLKGTYRGITTVALSPDGQKVASGAQDGSVDVWDVESAMSIRAIGVGPGSVSGVAFSSDGHDLVAQYSDGSVIVWDGERAQRLGAPFINEDEDAAAFAFSADGKTLALASNGTGEVTLWEVAQAQVLTTLPESADAGPAARLAFSPDGKTLAAVYADGSMILWDVEHGESIGALPTAGQTAISGITFSPDGKVLASAADDGSVILWDVEGGESMGAPLTGPGRVTSITFSPDGQTLASGGYDDGSVILWDMAREPAIGTPPMRTDLSYLCGDVCDTSVTGVTFSPDGQTLASVYATGSVVLWNTELGQRIGEPLAGNGDVLARGLAFSRDGKILAFGAGNAVSLWSVASGQPNGAPLVGDDFGAVIDIAFSPDAQTLAAGYADGSVRLWNVELGQQIGEPLGGNADASVISVAFSPDGKIVASCAGNAVNLWNVDSGQPNSPPLVADDFGEVIDIAFSPDGQTLASGYADGSVRLWNVELGQQIGEPLGGKGVDASISVAFSPDGKTVAESDGSISLRSVENGQTVGMPLVSGLVGATSLAFSSDGQALVAGYTDASIIVWKTSLESWAETACRMANRNLTQDEWRRYLGAEDYRQTCP
jgi:WD40 repeat protein